MSFSPTLGHDTDGFDYVDQDLPPHPPSPPSDTPDHGPDREASEDGLARNPLFSVDIRDCDPNFYFNTCYVVFEAENTLFRVPTYMLANESKFFITELKIPVEDNFETQSKPEPTIALPSDVRADDFRNFLKVLYPITASKTLTLSKAEWISVLKLSTKWRFKDVRKMAIAHLDSLYPDTFTPIENIVFGRKCFVFSWLLSGMTDVVTRTETISDDDAIEIDYITALPLFRLREKRLSRLYSAYDDDLTQDLNSVFAAEFSFIKEEEKVFAFTRRSCPLYSHPLEEPQAAPVCAGGKKKKKKK